LLCNTAATATTFFYSAATATTATPEKTLKISASLRSKKAEMLSGGNALTSVSLRFKKAEMLTG
jgi:hypothetical protein